jgi:hypothetical protein
VYHYARILCRTLYMDAADRRMTELPADKISHRNVGIQIVRVLTTLRIPSRRPILDNAEPNSNRIYFLAHFVSSPLVGHGQRDVTGTLRDSVRPAASPRSESAHRRSLIDMNEADVELIDVNALVVFGICNCGLQYLLQHRRGLGFGERQNLDRLFHRQAPDLIGYEPCLLR